MSTDPPDILRQVRGRMQALRLTQAEVAKACRVTQPHLSKLLSGKIKMGRKTAAALSEWLARSELPAEENGELRRIVEGLMAAPPEKRMQIMQLLRAVQQIAH
ncbi:transcriptional regulator with XRE-family HTH domain [Microvirga flocculans]|uniref:Transcriptional regulator with XRE-family HTH domain n=1 Tax=Microvirga flocculans TaxID=217168 RepID=A0A7W6IIT2_9HYPH|nr:helix-turn-helix transcriptional regulator [Microvirga flocculans]MBB4041654.1 transcriptional regulator with XRE-family HTH domain [Microvirga flocculans]